MRSCARAYIELDVLGRGAGSVAAHNTRRRLKREGRKDGERVGEEGARREESVVLSDDAQAEEEEEEERAGAREGLFFRSLGGAKTHACIPSSRPQFVRGFWGGETQRERERKSTAVP